MSKEKKNPLLGEETVEETTAQEAVVTSKVTPKLNADDALLSDIEITKKKLEAEEKVHFLIPLTEGEKPGSTKDVFINGARYTIKKGVMTTVPKSVSLILAEHYKVGMEAGTDFRLDLNADKQDKLS
jgi:hypothetical protein